MWCQAIIVCSMDVQYLCNVVMNDTFRWMRWAGVVRLWNAVIRCSVCVTAGVYIIFVCILCVSVFVCVPVYVCLWCSCVFDLVLNCGCVKLCVEFCVELGVAMCTDSSYCIESWLELHRELWIELWIVLKCVMNCALHWILNYVLYCVLSVELNWYAIQWCYAVMQCSDAMQWLRSDESQSTVLFNAMMWWTSMSFRLAMQWCNGAMRCSVDMQWWDVWCNAVLRCSHAMQSCDAVKMQWWNAIMQWSYTMMRCIVQFSGLMNWQCSVMQTIGDMRDAMMMCCNDVQWCNWCGWSVMNGDMRWCDVLQLLWQLHCASSDLCMRRSLLDVNNE